MLETLRGFADRLLGRGDAAITVPVMDGVLKPNRALEEAAVVATLEGLDDLAWDGSTLWASAGPLLYRIERADGHRALPVQRFEREITALAVQPFGGACRSAVALGGTQLRLLSLAGAAPPGG
ncbi:strictosidine synthase, partial [Verminephrobacter eiseniae]|nr:strictosidine synthase [Verminephrobacter eiseniae]